VTVFRCPCGEPHPEHVAILDQLGPDLSPLVIMVNTGDYKVPRLWIAAHGIKGSEIALLAAKYGWEKVG